MLVRLASWSISDMIFADLAIASSALATCRTVLALALTISRKEVRITSSMLIDVSVRDENLGPIGYYHNERSEIYSDRSFDRITLERLARRSIEAINEAIEKVSASEMMTTDRTRTEGNRW